jgi:YD repeat-containing protein
MAARRAQMSHENRRCRQPRWSANACSGVLLLLLACSASAGAQENPLEATGVQPSRAYVSVLPWEQIDAYSGNLILTFTDLVLPGNAGFDLALTRTYNNKGGGAHWTFNPGKVTHADIQGSNLHNPQIVTGEDARGEPTFETAQGSGIFRTRRYWEYHRATHVASLPNGVTYTYDYFWNTEHRNERYLTEMRDAFGNTVTFFYVQPDPAQPPRLDYLVQDLGNGQTREVTFTYTAAGQRETMTYLERTWTYTWDGSQLTAVTPPVGAGWAYGYEGPWLTSVTTPNGGVVTYVYEWQTFSGHQTLILSQRTASEREVHDGPWYFWYHGSYTWVINDANETVYRFDTVSPLDDPGTLVRRETWHDGTCVEAQDLTWQASVALGLVDWSYDDPPAPYAPLLQSSTITRQGHAFVTTSLYKQTDLNDYGQPWQVTEDGDFTRVTTRTFRHGFPTFIRGKLESETVTVAGQSFTRSFAYDDQGFLWADETYGVVTTFTRTSVGNVASTTDADNHTTTVSHAWGVVENTSTPAYPITRVINPDGTVASETRGGATTSYSYDALGRVRWMTPLVGAATETRYDPAGATIETQRDVSWVRQTLDGFGRVIGAEDAVGVVTAREYDGVGRLARETAPY